MRRAEAAAPLLRKDEGVTTSQRELLAKYLSDLSKGLLLAAIVGWGTGKLGTAYVLIDIMSAFYTIAIAYFLEGWSDDADE